jgi:hypothetical protein
MGVDVRASGGRLTNYVADCKRPIPNISVYTVMHNQKCLELTRASLH